MSKEISELFNELSDLQDKTGQSYYVRFDENNHSWVVGVENFKSTNVMLRHSVIDTIEYLKTAKPQ